MNRHKVPFEEEQVDDRRSLLTRCNDLSATVRERDHTIERLEHEVAHLKYQLDTQPKRKRRSA